MTRAPKAEAALDAIRKTICLRPSDGDHVLHETELAHDFGMSRTPIRQILQRLAYERLVQTRSGVGTVVTPLVEEHRSRDLCSYRGLIAAILLHDLPALSLSQHADVLALDSVASALQPGDPDLHYELLTRLHGITVQLVEDPVLADAYSASFWRALRWHMRDLASDPQRATAELRARVARLAAYEDRQGSDLFARLVDPATG